jgi:sigma-B regulation protein RsbU (phosphoserine phosphatase)
VDTRGVIRAGTAAQRPGHRGLPLRVLIAGLFVGLLAAAGVAGVGYGYVVTSRLLLSAGDEEFLHVAERTAGQVRDLLAPAQVLVQLLSRHRLADAAGRAARLDSLPLLTTALNEHPEISAVYVGFASGEFLLARTLRGAPSQIGRVPPEAVFLVQSRPAGEGAIPGRFRYLDRQLAVLGDESRPDYVYDPRTRGWYAQAMTAAATVRTKPYVFFTTREVGTTIAQRSADGRSVVGADIALQELSRHLARSRVTPSARIALVDRLGLVVALPDAGRLVRIEPSGDPALVRLDDLGDRTLGSLFAAAAPASGGIPLVIEDRAWIGLRRPIEAGTGEPLILLLAAPRDELVAGARGLVERQLLIGLGVLGLSLGLVWLVAGRLARPLESLAGSVARIGQGDLDTALPLIQNPREVAALSDVTDRMRVQLQDHIAERAERLAAEQRQARELEIARQIQRSMLPVAGDSPLDGRFAIAATLLPAREVGGDLYDFFVPDERRLVFAIGDVADKGVPAALLMARVTALFRAIAPGETGPDGILRELDLRLSQGNDACMFVTAACGVLDGETGELRYASAGHEPPVLRRADGTTVVLAPEGGPALGLDGNGAYPVWTGRLAPGDALVLCTDGVTEAFDVAGDAFGLERLRRVVADTPADALRSLPDRLVDAVERFAAGGGPRDDLALLAVQYRPTDVVASGAGDEGWRLSVSGAPEDIARAQRRIEGILLARDVPPPIVHDCVVAAEEVMGNIATHAYGGRPSCEAGVEIRLLPEEIQIRFEDAGPPFNPLEQPAPDVEAPIAERGVGGLGIFLVRQLADRCEYAREGSTNVLTVHHRRPAVAPREAFTRVQESFARGGTMALDIEITDQEAGGRRVTLRGRLDTLTAPQLETALAPLLDAPAVTSIAFALDGLEYISSAGIRCLMRAHKALGARGGRVAIVNPQPAVRKVLEIVKALPSEQVFGSDAELDAYLNAMQRKVRGDT